MAASPCDERMTTAASLSFLLAIVYYTVHLDIKIYSHVSPATFGPVSIAMLLPALVLVGASLLPDSRVELIPTPGGGLRPRECVLEVPHGSHVAEIRDGTALLITHRATNTAVAKQSVHVVPEICHDALYQGWYQGVPANKTCDVPPCTCSQLPCNNWVDNAGLFPKDSAGADVGIGGFSSVYTVPGTPRAAAGNEVLFYFIGAENTDGYPRHGANGVGRTILQPVLTFDPAGWCAASSTGWCMSSWNCCPANVSTHSPYLLDLRPGDALIGSFALGASNESFEVVSRDVARGTESALLMSRDGRTFNWADVTLEVYNIERCTQFASGPMLFERLQLWDTDLKAIVPARRPTAAGDDAWLLTTDKVGCGGSISPKGNPPTAFSIEYARAGHTI